MVTDATDDIRKIWTYLTTHLKLLPIKINLESIRCIGISGRRGYNENDNAKGSNNGNEAWVGAKDIDGDV